MTHVVVREDREVTCAGVTVPVAGGVEVRHLEPAVLGSIRSLVAEIRAAHGMPEVTGRERASWVREPARVAPGGVGGRYGGVNDIHAVAALYVHESLFEHVGRCGMRVDRCACKHVSKRRPGFWVYEATDIPRACGCGARVVREVDAEERCAVFYMEGVRVEVAPERSAPPRNENGEYWVPGDFCAYMGWKSRKSQWRSLYGDVESVFVEWCGVNGVPQAPSSGLL